MQKYQRMLGRRAILFFLDWLVIVLFLLVWMIARKPVPTGRAIPYIQASSHVLVQLAKLSELTEAKMHDVPEWTLYGDGTLIFRTDPSGNLWRARLSPGEIQHILDVVINQDKFFDNTVQRYSTNTPESDDDKLLLTVNANGQQREVVLVSKPTSRSAIDIQTTHVFAVEQFLLDYHSLHSVLYASNPDLDRGDGQ